MKLIKFLFFFHILFQIIKYILIIIFQSQTIIPSLFDEYNNCFRHFHFVIFTSTILKVKMICLL